MNIEYEIYNPGGNITALVINKNYNKKEIKDINDYLLKKYKQVEQVAFLDIDKNNLKMAGGEFCVNAARCALYYNIKIFNKDEITFLDKRIKGKINNNYISIKYDINKNIKDIIKTNARTIVYLEGISIVILDKETNDLLLKQKSMNKIKTILKDLDINDKAVGIVLIDEYSINPFIWVKDIDTLYNETACGSASIATALYYYLKTNKKEYRIMQPSKEELEIKLNIKNCILKEIEIKGVIKNENTKC